MLNKGCVVTEAVVCRTPALFVAQGGRCIVNEEDNCRKRKDGLTAKAVACCPGEVDPVPGQSSYMMLDKSPQRNFSAVATNFVFLAI